MIVYKYDKVTKEYNGEIECQLDPLETQIQGKDVFLIPANSTKDSIPIFDENIETIIYENGWKIIEDIRKKTWYSKIDGEIHKVYKLNQDISELTNQEPPDKKTYVWDDQQKKWKKDTDKEKKKNINTKDSEIVQLFADGYDYNGNIISTTIHTQINIERIRKRIDDGLAISYPILISCVDGDVVSIPDQATFLSFYEDYNEYLYVEHQQKLAERDSINQTLKGSK